MHRNMLIGNRRGWFVFFFLMAVLAVAPGHLRAAGDGTPFSDAIDISTLEVTGESSEALSLAFSLSNRSPFERTVRYTVFFQPTDLRAVSYTQVIRETVMLPSEGSVPITTTIPAPRFLSGNYELFIRVESVAGAFLAQGHATPVALTSVTSLALSGCKTSDGTSLAAGETLSLKEKSPFPAVTCTLASTMADPRPQNVQFVGSLTDYSLAGKVVSSSFISAVVVGDEASVVTLPAHEGGLAAGGYMFTLEVQNDTAQIALPPIVLPVSVSGKAARVLTQKPDLTGYGAGSTATVALNLALFGEDRAAFTYETMLSDAGGECGRSSAQTAKRGETLTATVPIIQDCQEYTVATTVRDKDGENLDTLSEAFIPTKQGMSTSLGGHRPWWPMVALAALVVILLGFFLMWMRRSLGRRPTIPPMMWFFTLGTAASLALFAGQPLPAKASYDAGYVWIWNSCGAFETTYPEGDASASLTFNKASYSPGETVSVTATVRAADIKAANGAAGSASFWFSFSIAGNSYTYSNFGGAGLTTGGSMSNTYSFAAPNSAGTYVSSGGLTLRSRDPGTAGTPGCRRFSEYNSVSGHYSFTVAAPVNPPSVTLNGAEVALNLTPWMNKARAGGSVAIACNKRLELNWTSSNATSCTASNTCGAGNFSGNVALNGGPVFIDYATLLGCSNRTFSIRCVNSSGNPTTDTVTASPVASCVPGPSCGNGVKDSGEECDNGGAANGSCPATCSASCTRNSCSSARCGDGNIDPGEQCDNGSINGSCPDTCSTSCTRNNCGSPPTLTCSATSPVSSGANTTFSWTSTNTNRCVTRWDNVDRPVSGTISVGPITRNRILSIWCVGSAGARITDCPVTLSGGNTAPTATITNPTGNVIALEGTPITFVGYGVDDKNVDRYEWREYPDRAACLADYQTRAQGTGLGAGALAGNSVRSNPLSVALPRGKHNVFLLVRDTPENLWSSNCPYVEVDVRPNLPAPGISHACVRANHLTGAHPVDLTFTDASRSATFFHVGVDFMGNNDTTKSGFDFWHVADPAPGGPPRSLTPPYPIPYDVYLGNGWVGKPDTRLAVVPAGSGTATYRMNVKPDTVDNYGMWATAEASGSFGPMRNGYFFHCPNYQISICVNSCNSGLAVADGSTRVLQYNAPPGVSASETLVACFGSAAPCDPLSPGEDVTAATTWAVTDTAPETQDAVNLRSSGSSPQVVTPRDPGSTPNTDTVRASYGVYSSRVNYIASRNCGSLRCDPQIGENTCKTKYFDGANDCEIIPNACQGSRTCDFNWKEVAP